jgi:crotonobetainyl-CoA:carnitine CoA-transferase CaiB-like acyl-CoA transferase
VHDTSPTRQGALAALRVIDLSRVLAGPLCTQILADHGADVIKIEPPSGDETRRLGPPFDDGGDAAYFVALNRGKRALALDLARPEGREVLERLLAHADVLVENFLPGTLERWGLGFEEVLAHRYPRLIHCSISGFGADGPLGGLPGYDAVLQAMCGVMSVNGSAETGPMRVGVPIVDYVTGQNALAGILLALTARERSGKGQRVETTLFDTALSLLLPHASNWLCSGSTPERLGNAHPNIAPYAKYAAGDGELFLGVVNDGQFRRFCAAVGRSELLDDPRFSTNPRRLEHRAALRAEIERTLATFRIEPLCDQLMRSGVPAGPVHTVPLAFGQPHARHREMLVERDGYRGTGIPVKLSRTPGQPTLRPPRFAEHADEVLRENGFGAEAIAALRAAGVLADRPSDSGSAPRHSRVREETR